MSGSMRGGTVDQPAGPDCNGSFVADAASTALSSRPDTLPHMAAPAGEAR